VQIVLNKAITINTHALAKHATKKGNVLQKQSNERTYPGKSYLVKLRNLDHG